MSRSVSAALLNAIAAKSVELYFAVEMLFDSGAVRLWTGWGNRTINGQVYQGTGALLGISGVSESNDLAAKGATVTLSGVNPNMISLALTEPYQKRVCRIYLGVRTEVSVSTIFSGLMDVMVIEDSGDSLTLGLSVESRIVQLDRPVVFRYTSQSHRSRYPGDTFFDWVTKLADKPVYWGKKGDATYRPRQ